MSENNIKTIVTLLSIVVLIVFIVIFVWFIIGICKYLKKCEHTKYSPLNFNIILAVIPLMLIPLGIQIAVPSVISFFVDPKLLSSITDSKLFWGVAGYAGVCMILVGVGSIILNIRNCYKRVGSLGFALFNFLVQFIMGILICATLGLGLLAMIYFFRYALAIDSSDNRKY